MPLEGFKMFKVISNTGSVCPDAFAVPSRVTVTDSILSVVKGPAFGGGGGVWDGDGRGELGLDAGDTGADDTEEDGCALGEAAVEGAAELFAERGAALLDLEARW
jgi:hypothetical protein